MKVFLLALLLNFSGVNQSPWLTDYKKALSTAHEEHKLIVLSFSGSDWCIPCIRLHKEIYDSEVFTTYAGAHLVLVNADFPRLKKNRLPAELVKQNEGLADQYNPDGVFPLTILLNENGKVLKKWEGYPSETAAQLTEEINTLSNNEH